MQRLKALHLYYEERRDRMKEKRVWMHPRILLFAAVMYTVGILLGIVYRLPVLVCLLVIGLLMGIGIWFWDGKRLLICGMAAALCAGIWAGGTVIPVYPDIDLSQTVTITGCVQKVIPSEDGYTYLLTEATAEGEALSKGIFLTSSEEYEQDTYIMAMVQLQVPEASLHPGDFDDLRYCMSQGVMYRGYSEADAATGTKGGLLAAIHRLSRNLGRRIDALFPQHGDLAKAFLLGDESDVDSLRKEQLRLTGLTHILSISGSHIAILAGLLHWVFRGKMIDRRIPFWVGQAVMVFYTILTGWKVSMVRALWMYEVAVWVKYLGKRNDPLTALAAAYLGILAGNPAQIFDLGLQLSFSAVLSMILLTRPLEEILCKMRPPILRQAVCTGIAATLGTLPITLGISHYIWLPGLLANTAAVLYSALMIPLLMGVTALALLFDTGAIWAEIGAWCIHIFDEFVSACAAIDHWGFYLPAMAPLLIGVWYFSLYLYSDKVFLSQKYKKVIAGALAVVFALGLLLPALPKKMTLRCFAEEDLCAVLTTEDGRNILISDGGGEAAWEYALERGMDYDVCIMTDVGSGSEALCRLYDMGRIQCIYAADSVATVLKYKWGYTDVKALPESLRISEQMYLRQGQEESTLLLTVAEDPACLFVLDFHENIAQDIGSIPILYYNKGGYSELPAQLEYMRFVYADQRAVHGSGENLYQTGMLEIDLIPENGG